MADYIDREKIFSIWRSMPAPASVTSLAAAISQTPAADVVEVQHGRWSPVAFGIGICTTKYRCSICKQYENVDRAYKYCPNCGARMGKEEQS